MPVKATVRRGKCQTGELFDRELSDRVNFNRETSLTSKFYT